MFVFRITIHALGKMGWKNDKIRTNYSTVTTKINDCAWAIHEPHGRLKLWTTEDVCSASSPGFGLLFIYTRTHNNTKFWENLKFPRVCSVLRNSIMEWQGTSFCDIKFPSVPFSVLYLEYYFIRITAHATDPANHYTSFCRLGNNVEKKEPK